MELGRLFQGCRTYRRFLQEPVPEEVILEMLDNVRMVSSAGNHQTLRFVAVREPETVERIQPLVKWAAMLPKEIGTPKNHEQPTAWIAIVKTPESGPWSDVDAGIAVESLVMTAYSRGIGSCIMGAIDAPAIAKILDLPDGYSIRMMIALGKPACESHIVDVPEKGELKYYVDENRNYYVPKRSTDELAHII